MKTLANTDFEDNAVTKMLATNDPVLDEFKAAAVGLKAATEAHRVAAERYRAALDMLNKSVCGEALR